MPRFISKSFLQFRVRPGFLWLGLAALIVTAAAAATPSADDRVQNNAHAIFKTFSNGQPPPHRTADDCERDVALIEKLLLLGDLRGVERLARILQNYPLSEHQWERVLEASFHDLGLWNTSLPRWKLDLLARAKAAGVRQTHLLDGLFTRVPVTFSFDPNNEKFRTLHISGNWDDSNALANLNGWKSRELILKNGRWTLTLPLQPTRRPRIYHAVVRTGPWPEGKAVGEAAFSVEGPRIVDIRRLPRSPIGPAAAATAPRDPAFGLTVLGIDGATWQVILPFVQRGFLPNFARLLKEGSTAELVSSPSADGHYDSTPNIYGAMTGKLAFRHGIHKDYLGINTVRRSSPLWMMASDSGLRAAALSMWSSFPPDQIVGAMVTEAFYALNVKRQTNVHDLVMTPEVLAFSAVFGVTPERIRRATELLDWLDGAVDTTHPPALARELAAVLPPTSLLPASGLKGLTELFDRQIILSIEHLARSDRFDLLCAYLGNIDNASHSDWNSFEPPGSAQSQVALTGADDLLKAYSSVDDYLGRLMRHSKRLIVFSDHGMGSPRKETIWVQFNASKLFAAFGTRHPGMLDIAFDVVKLKNEWDLWITQPSDENFSDDLVAYMKTAVYVPGREPVFTNVSRSVSRKGSRIRFDLRPPGGSLREGVLIGGRQIRMEELLDLDPVHGKHMGNGMLALWGNDVKPGRLPDDIVILDVAPTALYLLGLPLASDMDGELIRPAIDASYLAANPPRYTRSYGRGGFGWLRLWRAVHWIELAQRVFTGMTRGLKPAPRG